MPRHVPTPAASVSRSRYRTRLRHAAAALTVCVLVAGRAAECRAQTLGEVAAWDALMVSPVGALPPRAHDDLLASSAPAEVSLRYGRWRYDVDDAIHNDFGVTLSRSLGASRSHIAFTVGYLSVSCGTCSAGVSGSVELQTPVLRRVIVSGDEGATTANVGVGLNAGGARFFGTGYLAASSVAASTSIGVAFPFLWSSRVAVSVLPGVGFGRLVSVDDDTHGTLPMLGASVALALRSGVLVDVGMQKVFISGGPNQFGMGLSLARR